MRDIYEIVDQAVSVWGCCLLFVSGVCSSEKDTDRWTADCKVNNMVCKIITYKNKRPSTLAVHTMFCVLFYFVYYKINFSLVSKNDSSHSYALYTMERTINMYLSGFVIIIIHMWQFVCNCACVSRFVSTDLATSDNSVFPGLLGVYMPV